LLWNVLYDPELGCSSYLVGDATTGQAAVIDPLGRIGPQEYRLAAQDLGAEIAMVVETHVHADHRSCAAELAQATGVPHALSRHTPARFPFRALAEGDRIALGRVELEVWETPGHTPDSISLLLRDRARADDVWAVLTGDSLFVGDVGRPDLAEAEETAVREAALAQFASVRRLMTLPDFTEIWPAHYGSSPCGGLFMSKKPSSTVGFERRHNRFCQLTDGETFVRMTLDLLKPPPADAAQIRADNLGAALSP